MAEFKGIMLCDRPADMMKTRERKSELVGFHVGAGIPEPLGINPCPKIYPKSTKQKSETALTKHLKWLARLAAEEKEKAAAAAAKEVRDAERHRLAVERAATLRSTVLAGLTTEVDAAVSATEKPTADEDRVASNAQATASHDPLPESLIGSQPERKAAAPKPGKPKPAWALTEEAALLEEEKEADVLLKFAESLDIDQYLDETTTKDLSKALKTLAELEDDEDLKKFPIKEQSEWTANFVQALNTLVSEDRDAIGEMPNRNLGPPSATSSVLRKAKAIPGGEQTASWDGSTVMDSKPSKREGLEAMAEDLLKEFAHLRAIHSSRSLAKVVESTAAAAAQLQRAEGAAAAAT